MSLVLAAAMAASAATLPVCSWDRPGVNVFQGDTVAAVDRYADIPAPARARLKQRMAARQYDEVAAIRRDSIEGRHRYSDLRDMHFGAGQVCRSVTRDKWADGAVERGLVYCEDGHCLIVPTVCRNVSRVTRLPAPPPAAAAAGGANGGDASTAAAAQDELPFDAPGAGPVAGAGPSRSGGGGSVRLRRPPGAGPASATCPRPPRRQASIAGLGNRWVTGGRQVRPRHGACAGSGTQCEPAARPVEDPFGNPPMGMSPGSTAVADPPDTRALDLCVDGDRLGRAAHRGAAAPVMPAAAHR